MANINLKTNPPSASVNPASRNYIVNGNFDIWQRGISFTTTVVYSADRWLVRNNGTSTFQAAQSNSTYAPPYQMALRATAASSNILQMSQQIEYKTFAPIVGKQCTLSMLLSARTLNVGSTTAAFLVWYHTNEDTNITFGGGGATPLTSVGLTLTTFPTIYAISFTIPSNAKSLAFDFGSPTNTAMLNDDGFEIYWAMLTEGIGTSQFVRAGVDIAQELQMCQRFYEKSCNQLYSPSNASDGQHVAYSGNASYLGTKVTFQVAKRATPTVRVWNPVAQTSGQIRRYDNGASSASSETSIGQSGFMEMGAITVGFHYHFGWEAWSEFGG